VIASRRHELVLRCRRLAAGRTPSDNGLLLDGPHLVSVALSCDWPLEVIAFTTEARTASAEVRDLVRRAERRGTRACAVAPDVMHALSPVRAPSGVLAIGVPVERPLLSVALPFPALVVVVLDVQDPGNVGAIVRAADAFGATGILCLGTCADPFGWKALRGSMGSALRLPVVRARNARPALAALRSHGVRLAVAGPRDGLVPEEWDARGPVALLVGNEGRGVPDDVLADADAVVSIPMRDGVESLNVAVSAGVLLAAARRHRTQEAPR
jgi:TrmH family RNA methyltransferase